MTTDHRLPFGKWQGMPLDEVPTSYLRWLVREAKLSTGLRAAVAAELGKRGVAVPEPPPPLPRRCHRCGGTDIRAQWMRDRADRKVIRGSCSACGSWVGALPVTPANVALADANSDPAALLSFLIALDERAITVRLVGGHLRFDPPLPRELGSLERQARGMLIARLSPEHTTAPTLDPEPRR